MKTVLASIVLTLTALLAVTPANAQSSDEATIRQVDAEWSKASAAKDVDKAVAFYADNASVLIPGQPMMVGMDAIRAGFTKTMADPNFALSFSPDKIDVSKSGDLAYEVGSYQLSMSDAQGKPQTVKAKYVVVWKKIDGKWRAVVDCPTTTM